jgi:short-subunit dehydrogenase
MAEAWVRRGAWVILSARREDRLRELSQRLNALGKGRSSVVACDVTSDESMRAAAARIQAEGGPIDTVIANAGFGVSGTVAKLSLQDYQRQFDTNVYGVIRTVQAALPLLRGPGSRIGLVGSVAGHVSLPGGSAYSMSKFAVRALAESLWAELHRKGISVTLISPGFVESDIRKIDNQGRYVETEKDPLPAWLVVPREKAALEIVRGVEARRKEVVITGHGRLIVFLIRYCKCLVDFALLRMVENRPEPKAKPKA